MNTELNREIILENATHPENRETVDNPQYIKVNSNNESCIDNIDLYIKFDNDKITSLKFDGEACAISTASTSIMTKLLINKTIDEVLDLCDKFKDLINHEENDFENLGEAVCFSEIYKQQNRRHCALLPWIGIKKAIEEYQNRKS